jgi:hypothetical protein
VIRSVAGGQADIDAAGRSAGKATNKRACKRVVVGKVGKGGTSDGTGKAARRRVLHAPGKRGGKKGHKKD